jgi:hypothetical protein
MCFYPPTLASFPSFFLASVMHALTSDEALNLDLYFAVVHLFPPTSPHSPTRPQEETEFSLEHRGECNSTPAVGSSRHSESVLSSFLLSSRGFITDPVATRSLATPDISITDPFR